jgi:molybdopterin synthase sulfur carrier subunit
MSVAMPDLHIRYFAWLKQRTGCAEERLELPPSVADVAGLKAYLGRRHPRFAAACEAAGIVRCAVNQELVEETAAVRAGDEVAFFPPVTGG